MAEVTLRSTKSNQEAPSLGHDEGKDQKDEKNQKEDKDDKDDKTGKHKERKTATAMPPAESRAELASKK